MHSYWAYILIGDNDTGKTKFQKYLVSLLCNKQYERLPSNLKSDITHARMARGVATLSTMNRSFQEHIGRYGDIEEFFASDFEKADICILSSHTHGRAIDDIGGMIQQLKVRAYNVAGVFFSNGYNDAAREISLLGWDERLWIENPHEKEKELIDPQLERLAHEFAHLLIARATLQ